MISKNSFGSHAFAWQQFYIYDLNNCFSLSNEKISCISFSILGVRKLISSPGVIKVKAKFALAGLKERIFNIILFGTDNLEVGMSTYFIDTPCLSDNFKELYNNEPTIDKHGTRTEKMGKDWTDNWSQLMDAVKPNPFTTNTGSLKGYTYDMKNFLDVLCHDRDVADDTLCIHLALHGQYHHGGTASHDVSFTFGMVMNGHENVIDSYRYTDMNELNSLTAPCAPTC